METNDLTPIQREKIYLEEKARMEIRNNLTAKVSQQSDGTAAVLSLVIPGAGQIYKGHLALGFFLMFLVYVCYVIGFGFMMISPLLHSSSDTGQSVSVFGLLTGAAIHLYCVSQAYRAPGKAR